jgi:hypothetical protein
MPPRPATIAAPPSTASPASWNPAVPPPPVTGAASGTGLGDGLGEGTGLALGDADGLTLVLTLVLTLTDVLALVLVRGEEPPLAVPVAVELVPAEGIKVDGGGVEAGLEVQAESATQASMVVRPQPTAVRRTRCDIHAMAVRALIEPPHVLGNDHFPVPGPRNEENAGEPNVKPRR